MAILGDHQGLWEAGRLVPASAVAICSVIVGGVIALRIHRAWNSPTPRRLAVLGFGFIVIGALAGALPRETAGGDNICGPVLHVLRDDSESCASAIDPLRTVVIAAFAAALASFGAAVLTGRRHRAAPPSGVGDQAATSV